MDNAARTRQRVLAIFLPVTAVLYISAEALRPKGTDQVISTTATAVEVLPIAARHPVAQRSGLMLVGPFVRNGKTSMMQRLLLRAAMAPPWAAGRRAAVLPGMRATAWGYCS